MTDWQAVAEKDFLLGKGEIYLNAGTFSALPRPVYERLVRILADLEANPTHGAAAARHAPLRRVQEEIARYLECDTDDLLFHANVTQALNQAFMTVPWPEGGEILTGSMEYGAILNLAHEVAARHRMTIRTIPIPRQPQNGEEVVDAVRESLGPRTAGVLLSHVSTVNGLVAPVERIGALLRERDIRFIVDGAHAPGLVPLSLADTDIDFYGGNLHKWFMGPKGTGFLHVRRDRQPELRPHLVGWGGGGRGRASNREAKTPRGETPFQQAFKPQGLRDAAPFLALSATLAYRRGLGEDAIRKRIADLAAYARRRLAEEAGLETLSPDPPLQAGPVSFALPGHAPANLSERLYQRDRITVVNWSKNGEKVLRVSAHVWNREADIDRLAEALRAVLDGGEGGGESGPETA